MQSISNSFQSAKRNSEVRTKVNIMNFIASNVVGAVTLSAFIFCRNSGNSEIGREFSNRDHTTIIHSVKTIEKLKEKDPEVIENINKLKNQILYNNKENEI